MPDTIPHDRSRVYVDIDACHDTTRFSIDTNDDEFVLLTELAAASQQMSSCSCQPTISVRQALVEGDDLEECPYRTRREVAS